MSDELMSKDSGTPPPSSGQFLVYQTEDGKLKIDVRFEGETDWLTQQHMDEFLKLSEHELLDHAGRISAEQAKMKAEMEYDCYRVFLDSQPRTVDLDFDKAVREMKKLPKPMKPKPPKP
jgi:hypothetical protein